MKNLSLKDYNLVPRAVINAVRFENFWDFGEEASEGEEVTLTLVDTVQLKANGPLHDCYQTGYVFETKYGEVTLCELHSWGSSEDSRYGDVFGSCGFRLI